MNTLGRTIALLKASEEGPYTVDERLNALEALLTAAFAGNRDRDATEILFDSGLKPDERRAVTDEVTSLHNGLEQALAAIAKARPRPGESQDKSTAA